MDTPKTNGKPSGFQGVMTLADDTGNKTLLFEHNQSILEALIQSDTPLPVHCGGSGVCGACKIQFMQHLPESPPTSIEVRHLQDHELETGIRLACQVRAQENLEIRIVNRPEISKWIWIDPANFLSSPGPVIPAGPAIQPDRERFGIAIDFGTTQLRLSLLNMNTKKRITAISGLNPQIRFGSDILRRLAAATNSGAAAKQLADLAAGGIADGISELKQIEGFCMDQIDSVTLVGNTAMLTLLSGCNYEHLLMPQHWMQEIDCQPHDIDALKDACHIRHETSLNIVPALAGFVGSDLIAALLGSRIHLDYDCALLIDFGTNSEIALWDGETLWATSAAGGPAFDGCGIRCGMPAGPGAIYRIVEGNDPACLVHKVIGQKNPAGICGSGLVDWIAILRQRSWLKPSGRLAKNIASDAGVILEGQPHIFLTHRGIDTFQRAKAAVGAGVSSVLAEARVKMEDVQQIFVCGAFGQHLDIQNAITVGLLPDIAVNRFTISCNAALAGCEHLMLSENSRELVESIRIRTRMVDLAQSRIFESMFADHLFLKPSR